MKLWDKLFKKSMSKKVPGFSNEPKETTTVGIEDASDKIYQKICNAPIAEHLPGGTNQIALVLSSLAVIYNLEAYSCSQQIWEEVFSSYQDVLVRTKLLGYEADSSLNCLKIKHNSLVKDDKTARRTYVYCLSSFNQWQSVIRNQEDIAKLDQFTLCLPDTSMQNISLHPAEDPEYGLVSYKPIMVNGIPTSKLYLSKLRSSQGESLSWKRHGSIKVDGVQGLTDIYESRLPNGMVYKTVYVNTYGTVNSEIFPSGFTTE